MHYTRTLLFRAGLITPDEFLAELNDTATRHFANPRAQATNEEIRRRFFDDDALSVVPYTRGALYAAELDAAIRRRSSGRRSLDDVVRELGLREAPLSAFRDAIRRELGAPGVARFAAVIEHGARPEPPSDAFGPCFRREARSIPLYELGFDGRAPAIRNLVPGSAAARAGLRDGDKLLSVESSPLFPARPATVTVERAGKPVAIQYLPARARLREGFWWVRVTGVPEERCR